jgi:hypothetical protein
MSNFKKGDLVKHKTSDKKMVVIGFSNIIQKIIFAKFNSENPNAIVSLHT